ncbi:DUF5994 family protein [Nocardia gipuzkoensis]
MTRPPPQLDSGQPRLRFLPEPVQAPRIGAVWWPHSDNLAAELPPLLILLSVRLGPIGRVGYHLDEWCDAPIGLIAAGRRVRLDGYRHSSVRTLDVLALGGARIALLVIPRHADSVCAATAHHDPGVAAAVDELVASTMRETLHDPESVVAQQHWDFDDGATTG